MVNPMPWFNEWAAILPISFTFTHKVKGTWEHDNDFRRQILRQWLTLFPAMDELYPYFIMWCAIIMKWFPFNSSIVHKTKELTPPLTTLLQTQIFIQAHMHTHTFSKGVQPNDPTIILNKFTSFKNLQECPFEANYHTSNRDSQPASPLQSKTPSPFHRAWQTPGRILLEAITNPSPGFIILWIGLDIILSNSWQFEGSRRAF